MIIKLGNFWEQRSKEYGSDPKGVLPKFLPTPLLNYLDSWMYSEVKKVLDRERIRILDLGCGYGRLALKIAKDYPQAEISGVDISQEYVDLFNANLGKHGRAVKGDVRSLPFQGKSFDVVIAVTTLMYMLTPRDQAKAVREMFRLLKDSGKFVIIERNPIGHNLITLGGLITMIRGEKNREIQAVGYTSSYMKKLVADQGGKTEEQAGLPFWTMFLPLGFLTSFLGGIQYFLKVVGFLDRSFSFFLTPSLYISYIGIADKKK